MSKKTVRVSLSALIVVSALTFLMYTSISEGAEYYKYVDEVMAEPDQWYGKRLRVHGYVLGDPRVNPTTLEYRFTVQANGKTVNAFYKGVVPDTFKKDAEVVLKGTLTPEGVMVEPDGVMAKCPSRYEADALPAAVR
jgi:cytochrome c-type biogenesis protein CcmE